MSYILDALRKSADERRKLQQSRNDPFDPLTPAGGDAGGRGRRFPVVPVLLTALLAAAVPAGFWWHGGQDDAVNRAPSRSATIPAPADQDEVAPSPAEIEPPPSTGPAQEEAAPTRSAGVASAPQHQPRSSRVFQPPPPPDPDRVFQPEAQPLPSRPSLPAAPQPQTGEATDPPPRLNDLSFALQALIPEMKFSGHVYSSTPARRMIMINTAIVREGDTVAPDTRLVEITENGVVMSFRETRFRVELF